MRSPRLLLLSSALLFACAPKADEAGDAAAGKDGEITLGQLCKHFVNISSESEKDQVGKRDRKEDYAECMASFPVMESQLQGAEYDAFRPCAMKAKTLEEFTACAPSLFKPAPPPVNPPKDPPVVG